MNEKHSEEKKEGKPFTASHEKNTSMAIVAYFLFFVPLLTEDKKDPFVMFHARQGFLVFVTSIIASVLNMTIILMPFGILMFAGTIALAIIGILHAAQGKEEKLPIIGDFVDKVPF